MKKRKRSLKRYTAAFLLLAVALTLSSGSIWAKYTKELTVTSGLSLDVTARYKYLEMAIGASDFKQGQVKRTTVSSTTVASHDITVLTQALDDNRTDDPRVVLDLTNNKETIKNNYPYIAITYMTNTDDSATLYLLGEGQEGYNETNKYQTFSKSGGKYVTTIVPWTEALKNSTTLTEIRLDYFGGSTAGRVFYLESIVFCDSCECAKELGDKKSAALNCTINYLTEDETKGTVSLASETIGKNGTPSGSTATAKDGYEFVSWTQNGEVVYVAGKIIPEKNGDEYESATYIATFKEKSETQADMVKFDFDFTSKQSTRVSGVNVDGNGVAVLEVTATSSDPWVEFTLGESSGLTLADYPYIAITYMTATDDDGAELFYMGDQDYGNTGSTGSDSRYYTPDISTTLSTVSDGKYVTAIVDAESKLSKSTYIDSIRFDYFAKGTAGDKFYLDSIVFCNSKAVADQWATDRSNALNCTINYKVDEGGGGAVNGDSETIGKNSTKILSGATATASDGYEFDGWYNGDTEVCETVTFVPTATNGLYQSATYTAKFTQSTVKNVTYDPSGLNNMYGDLT